jgi:two-component system sensor histidine kinase ChvG
MSFFQRLVDALVRIRVRLLVINLIAVLVPVVGIHWAKTFEAEGLKALERDMRHVAETLRTIVENHLDRQGRPKLGLLKRALVPIAKRTRMRVRVLDARGHVVIDSHRHGPPEGPERVPRLIGRSYVVPRKHSLEQPRTDPGPLDGRREIRAAKKGQLGTATRYHHRIKRVYLFLALPVMSKRRVHGVVYVTRSTIPVLAAMYRLRTTLIKVLIVALVITALMTLFLAATISRPLTQLTRSAERLAAGDRNASLRLERRDEIGQLARSFAKLLDKHDARACYIAEFAANISHEFKTPLASMRGAAELLADSPEMDEEARQRFLSNILSDVRRLDRLVSRLLQLSRIEATPDRRERFDIVATVRECIASFADSRFDCQLPDTLPVRGDPQHLLSAMRAIVENATRYADPDQPITIRLRRDDVAGRAHAERPVVIAIRDRGEGISPSNLERIFDRFFTTAGQEGGTGLGLAIAKTVVDAHGGQIKVSSEVGKGTEFELFLPIAAE